MIINGRLELGGFSWRDGAGGLSQVSCAAPGDLTSAGQSWPEP
jgi:hypothetical protein